MSRKTILVNGFASLAVIGLVIVGLLVRHERTDQQRRQKVRDAAEKIIIENKKSIADLEEQNRKIKANSVDTPRSHPGQ